MNDLSLACKAGTIAPLPRSAAPVSADSCRCNANRIAESKQAPGEGFEAIVLNHNCRILTKRWFRAFEKYKHAPSIIFPL